MNFIHAHDTALQIVADIDLVFADGSGWSFPATRGPTEDSRQQAETNDHWQRPATIHRAQRRLAHDRERRAAVSEERRKHDLAQA
jgi:hypothetical protein